MTDIDYELIAALAEGSLPAGEAADLEARIAADPAASAELEAQRVALAAIAAAAPPRLDDMERLRLHRSVAAELDLVLPERAVAPRRRWSVNWSALATAAAVLLGVALAAPLLSLLNTSGSSSDATITVAEAPDDAAGDGDTELQASELAPAETLPAAADEESAGSPTEEPAATTAAAPETTVVADTAADDQFAAYGLELDFGPLDRELSQVRSRFDETASRVLVETDTAVEAEPPPCVDDVRARLAAGGADPSVTDAVLLGTGTLDDAPVYVLAIAEDAVVQRLVAVDVLECTEVVAVPVE